MIDRVKARLAEVQGALPEGVRVVTTYDRSGLIRDSIHTLRRTLLEEAIVVSLVALAFLFHFRSALIPIITLPVAVLASFVPMYYLGVSSNIMSLGGLALAIGELVDASIVMVENAYRHITETPDGRPATVPIEDQPAAVIAAAKQVGRPIFFSLAIIILSFLPVFLLEAQEGRMFRPLAFTKTFAMASATLLSVTLVPVLMTFILRGRKLRPEAANPFSPVSVAIYRACLAAALRFRWTTLVVNFAVIPAVIPLIAVIGSEFMPPLYEGSLLYMPTAPPGHVDHRGHAPAAAAGPGAQPISRGGASLRDRRPRHDRHRQLAHGDGEHHADAEAARAVAQGHDGREAAGRDG